MRVLRRIGGRTAGSRGQIQHGDTSLKEAGGSKGQVRSGTTAPRIPHCADLQGAGVWRWPGGVARMVPHLLQHVSRTTSPPATLPWSSGGARTWGSS